MGHKQKGVAFTLELPKLVMKSRTAHRPTKAEKPKKGKGAYNRRRTRDWRNF